jgi:hypothetical protein
MVREYGKDGRIENPKHPFRIKSGRKNIQEDHRKHGSINF